MAKKSGALALRAQGRIKEVIQRLVTIPIKDLGWDELQEWVEKDEDLQLEEIMHLAQVRKAIEGDTKAYSALMERLHGKVPNANLNVKGTYKDFLEDLDEDVDEEPTPEIDVTPKKKLAMRRKPGSKPRASRALPPEEKEKRRQKRIAAEKEFLENAEEEHVPLEDVEDLM